MVFTRPWFISEAAGNALELDYSAYLSGGFPKALWDDEDDDEDQDDDWPFDVPKYPTTDDGLACIPVRGTLVHSDYAFAYNFATSYSGIAAMCEHAMGSDQVKGILFCHNSPGGMATSSMFDLCDSIYGMRGQKPMVALSQDSCYSASYLIASAADRMCVTRCGGVGSIGAWMSHMDISKALEMAGLKITLIQSGSKKTDGTPTAPLPDRVKADFQSEVDRLRGMFAQAVAATARVPSMP